MIPDEPHERDEHFMRAAIAQAELAAAHGDVPVGAVIVADVGELTTPTILAVGHNRREIDGDPTAHAEVEALRAAARAIGHWRVEASLYVTQEPCPMCAGALVNARVRRLVYGCDNPKAGAVRTLYTIPTDTRLNHRMEVVPGVLADACATLLKEFFARLRQQ